jgi:four helix bundle protein
MRDGTVQQKSFEFALSIIRLYKKLQARQEFILSTQLLRSGTSVGIHVEQANVEHSHEEFVSGLLIAVKAAREAKYWLRLLQESKLADVDVAGELSQVDELIALLVPLAK